MSDIKEIELTKVTELLATDYIRGIRVSDGESIDILRSDFRLTQAQIIDLLTALAGKQDIATVLSSIAFSKHDGVVNGSGFGLGTLASKVEMDAVFNGIYTVETPFQVPPMGNVLGVIALSNDEIGETPTSTTPKTARRVIFTDLGMFYQTYSATTWYNPLFLGGSTENISDTRANLIALAGDSYLTPGALYKITDHGNDEGIIIQAVTSSNFSTDGLRLGLVPRHYIAGDYTFGEYTSHWIGVWRASIGDAGVSIGDRAVFMGRVWYNETGNIGTIEGDWSLDSTNWTLLPVELSEHYDRMTFGCTYDITNDYISKQWDSFGNELGEYLDAGDWFLVEYNDWNIGEGNPYSLYGCKLRRCYDNIVGIYNSIANASGLGKIYHNDFSGGVQGGIGEIEIHEDSAIYNCSTNNATISGILKSTLSGLSFTSNYIVRDDVTPFKTTTGETLRLDVPVYDDVNFALAGAKLPPSNTPTWRTDFDTHLGAYTFAVNDYADMGTIEIPHTYKEGTDLLLHIHLASRVANDATARKVKYTAWYSYGIPDSGSNQFITEQSLTAELSIAALAPNKTAYFLTLGTIPGANLKIGTQVKLRLYRVAGTGTEPANDPYVGQVGIHFQVDTLGSRQISAK